MDEKDIDMLAAMLLLFALSAIFFGLAVSGLGKFLLS